MDLNFRAINYSGEVYLNGHKELLPKGMFRRHSIDITDILNSNGKNLLAVLIYPPDHPGKIPPDGGQGGDHEVFLEFTRTSISLRLFIFHTCWKYTVKLIGHNKF